MIAVYRARKGGFQRRAVAKPGRTSVSFQLSGVSGDDNFDCEPAWLAHLESTRSVVSYSSMMLSTSVIASSK
jgi:hypothetical protein